LRRALGSFPTGVTVVGVAREGAIHGMTVNSFMSVSLEPPLVLVSIAQGARMRALLQTAERFGISVLSDTQRDVCQHFAGHPQSSVSDPFRIHEGVPLVRHALATFVCNTRMRIAVGDHTLFVGEVLKFERFPYYPLIFAGGTFNSNWWDGVSG
jgi:flavin reductase (DIM6/NTAB) family NADH-FMN oxidoreductase RutF